MKKLFSIIILSLLVGCQPGSKAPTPKDTDDCDDACYVLRALKCPEGEDIESSDGTMISCVSWCRYTQKELKVPLNPSCVKTIENCNQLETKCPVGSPK